MDASDRGACFVGDLDDPWVAEIAQALAGSVARIYGTGLWPDELDSGAFAASTLVLHRVFLSSDEAERLAKFRASAVPPRVVLCVSPLVRYAELEHWSRLVDVILSEATAKEVIARHVASLEGTRAARPAIHRAQVGVVSTNLELRQTLGDACEADGYPVVSGSDWASVGECGLVLWDVPVLEAGWRQALQAASGTATIVALFGFADRELVAEARAHGAAACLELPCDIADLVFVIDRIVAHHGQPAHAVPPRPAHRRRARPVADASPDSYNEGSVRLDSARGSQAAP